MVVSTYAQGGSIAPVNTATITFISAIATINVTSPTQAILVDASAALGSVAVGGGTNLRLSICWQLGAGLLNDNGDFHLGLRVAQNTRDLWSLTGRFTGLAAGAYKVGLCGTAEGTAAGWNSNEWSRTRAVLVNQ